MYFILNRIEKIIEDLSTFRCRDQESVAAIKFIEGDFKGGEKTSLDTSKWELFQKGERWGGHNKHFWFRTDVVIPDNYIGKTVVLEIRTGDGEGWDALNPQFLLYVNGTLLQGIDLNHREVVLTECAIGGESFEIALNAYSGMEQGKVELIVSTSILERDVEKLYYDLAVPLGIAKILDPEDKRRIDILGFLNDAVNLIDFRRPQTDDFYHSIKEASQFLEREFYGEYCGNEDVIATCVGHTHIDVAWLWTLSQTREKTVRSFSTVINMMKEYPEYIFMSSQPQLYKFVKEENPQLYSQIKEKIKEGRWEPEGGMWLEADCNVTSGESLVRQILFGKRFFMQEFGIDSKILWLPDVFGYSAALPQILKKSGIDYFMTTKISWNEYNKMPYDTFMWEGVDGTEVLTHFITTIKKESWQSQHFTTYNGVIEPSQVIGAWDRYQQKSLNNEVLISYGYGDGGGGPTKLMLENARRMNKGIPGCPKVETGNALNYFKRLEKRVSGNKKLPKWVGELYLEYHRGTLTSMARNKKYNRKSEFMYQDVELLSVVNNYANEASIYPKTLINKGWETILLNQFHDILPGSSIKEVYEESQQQYIEVLREGQSMLDTAISGIVEKINIESDSVVVFNQLSFERSDVVEFDLPIGWEGAEISDYSGKVLSSQIIYDFDAEGCNNKKVIFFAQKIPSKGYKTFRIKKIPNAVDAKENFAVEEHEINSKYFNIKFDDEMNIYSIFDKANNREVLKAGQKANVLQAFEDRPHMFDAWEIKIYYQEKMWEISDVESAEVIERGPVRAAIKIKRKFVDSLITQYIYVYNDIPRIDFSNLIDWKEKQILLKAAFPVDIHNEKATYEIQYGNVERPTHWNTSWDYARFEVCAQKWADLSEDGYGVSLMNDCKYGYDIKDQVMRLTLLKSATYPNEDADREMHEFTYSLYPHLGGWRDAGTIQMAYSLNCPMYIKVCKKHEGNLPAEVSLVSMDKDNVVIEVVKEAEDNKDIIIRLYECYNRRTEVNLTYVKELAKVLECDLLENCIGEIKVSANCFKFLIEPYEIKTFKLKMK